jgi:hypothetical protein
MQVGAISLGRHHWPTTQPRCGVGIERDPTYFKITCDRIRQAYADRAPGPLFEEAAE